MLAAVVHEAIDHAYAWNFLGEKTERCAATFHTSLRNSRASKKTVTQHASFAVQYSGKRRAASKPHEVIKSLRDALSHFQGATCCDEDLLSDILNQVNIEVQKFSFSRKRQEQFDIVMFIVDFRMNNFAADGI